VRGTGLRCACGCAAVVWRWPRHSVGCTIIRGLWNLLGKLLLTLLQSRDWTHLLSCGSSDAGYLSHENLVLSAFRLKCKASAALGVQIPHIIALQEPCSVRDVDDLIARCGPTPRLAVPPSVDSLVTKLVQLSGWSHLEHDSSIPSSPASLVVLSASQLFKSAVGQTPEPKKPREVWQRLPAQVPEHGNGDATIVPSEPALASLVNLDELLAMPLPRLLLPLSRMQLQFCRTATDQVARSPPACGNCWRFAAGGCQQ